MSTETIDTPPVASARQGGAAVRILFVDHTAAMGGGEIALLNLVRHLDQKRYMPVVALLSDGPLREKLIAAGAEVHLLPLNPQVINTRKDSLGGKTIFRVRDVFSTMKFTWRMSRFILAANIGLVHTNSLKADIIGGVAAKLARTPLIWHVRDRIDNDYLPPSIVRIFRRLARWLPDCVIANSGATLTTLSKGKLEHSAAIHSGVDISARLSVVHDGTLERNESDAGKQSDVPLVGLVGRISPWKGQHIFLRAAAQVLQNFPQTRFQIIGAALFNEADYEKFIRDMTRTLNLESVVEYTGFRQDVPELISELTILVHASVVGEPFGQVVIEGMAAGKPVIATNGGGVPEIVLNGETGILVPMGDADAMAAAICRLLREPELAARMGALGRDRVRDHFTIQSTARKVERLYDDVLQRKSAKSK